MVEKLALEYLPKNATCVFKGILFDVYHWEQKLFDGSTKTFEAVIRCGSVQVLYINPDNTITLFKESQPHLGEFISLPGGQVDEGESAEDALKREVYEELGVKVKKFSLWKAIVPMKKLIWPTYYYIVKGDSQKVTPQKDAGEIITPFQVTFDEFLEYLENPLFRNQQLSNIIYRIKHNPEDLEKLKKTLFG